VSFASIFDTYHTPKPGLTPTHGLTPLDCAVGVYIRQKSHRYVSGWGGGVVGGWDGSGGMAVEEGERRIIGRGG
jgi:hypothetical protein